jgi:uncharacterized protein
MSMTRAPELRALTLTITERCNLRCRYCYVPRERGRVMSEQVADQSVDLLLRHATGPKTSLFFFGGEPLLGLETMRRATTRARAAARPGQALEVGVTTNATLLRGEALDFCRSSGLRLAVSLDGDAGPSERLDASGEPVSAELGERWPDILALGAHDGGARTTARMTVTPTNVAHLADNVRRVAALGFRRIVFLPAFELAWTEPAIEVWAREQRRIGTWLRGALAAGRRPPVLETWRGIDSRLVRHKPRRPCGAGVRAAAVSTDGGLYPCYRFVFADDAEAYRLGHVSSGFADTAALELMATLTPARLRPEQGSCASCSARDGCTFFCPALGHLMLRDPWGVPATACQLMRAEVAAVRAHLRAADGSRAKVVARSLWAGAALLASALVPLVSTSSCGSDVTVEQNQPEGGVCPVQLDGGNDGDAAQGGVCPVQTDASDDADPGGVCPVQIDASDDAEPDDADPGGLCPVQIDGSDDGGMGGLC